MGKFSRDKGNRTERTIVNTLQDHGLAAERVPLSGAAGGRYAGDISCPILGEDECFEVKCRAEGFRTIYDWLGTNYGLFLKADRRETLVVLRLEDFASLAIQSDTARLSPTRASIKKRAA